MHGVREVGEVAGAAVEPSEDLDLQRGEGKLDGRRDRAEHEDSESLPTHRWVLHGRPLEGLGHVARHAGAVPVAVLAAVAPHLPVQDAEDGHEDGGHDGGTKALTV